MSGSGASMAGGQVWKFGWCHGIVSSPIPMGKKKKSPHLEKFRMHNHYLFIMYFFRMFMPPKILDLSIK